LALQPPALDHSLDGSHEHTKFALCFLDRLLQLLEFCACCFLATLRVLHAVTQILETQFQLRAARHLRVVRQ